MCRIDEKTALLSNARQKAEGSGRRLQLLKYGAALLLGVNVVVNLLAPPPFVDELSLNEIDCSRPPFACAREKRDYCGGGAVCTYFLASQVESVCQLEREDERRSYFDKALEEYLREHEDLSRLNDLQEECGTHHAEAYCAICRNQPCSLSVDDEELCGRGNER